MAGASLIEVIGKLVQPNRYPAEGLDKPPQYWELQFRLLAGRKACAIPASGFGESTAAKPIKSRIDVVLSCGPSVGEGRPLRRLQPIFIEQRER